MVLLDQEQEKGENKSSNYPPAAVGDGVVGLGAQQTRHVERMRDCHAAIALPAWHDVPVHPPFPAYYTLDLCDEVLIALSTCSRHFPTVESASPLVSASRIASRQCWLGLQALEADEDAAKLGGYLARASVVWWGRVGLFVIVEVVVGVVGADIPGVECIDFGLGGDCRVGDGLGRGLRGRRPS